MQEGNKGNSPAGKREDDEALNEQHSEATSDETLGDVRENEKSDRAASSEESGPSPDGQLDETDEVKDAGPM